MINIILSGCNGKMGRVITRLAQGTDDINIVCGYDVGASETNDYPVYSDINDFDSTADVVVDFSHPSVTDKLIDYCKNTQTALVMATTGLSDSQIENLNALSEFVPVFRSANMSIGINLLINLAEQAATLLEGKFDIEIVEKHHNQKIDAPSGTALMIADGISDSLCSKPEYIYDRHSVRKKRDKNEIGIHSVRGGTIVGEHDVIFAGNDEILEIRHTAMSKEIFAEGALRAALFIAGRKPGMYNMKNLIELN